METKGILLLIFPLLLLFAAGESWILRRRGRPVAWRESLASFAVALGHQASGVWVAALGLGSFTWLWPHRLWTVPLRSPWAWAGLFLAVEFTYYWEHRLSHEIRWMWASHAVHHSPEHLTLSAAYRLAWTGYFSGLAILFAPLVWLGFAPKAIGAMLALNLLYQFWLHTELVPRLGWFDRVFNSPSNHRVHHAVNGDYLDRNYGGVLMVFDHLFGTYQAERPGEVCRCGLVHPLRSHNPFVIALREWKEMLGDALRADGLIAAASFLLGRPGWRPRGGGLTTEALREKRGLDLGHGTHPMV